MDQIDATELAAALEQKYGALMGYDALAKLLNRSRRSMRRACNEQDWGRRLRAASVRIGRRRYFLTAAVGKMFASGELAEPAAAPRAGINAP